MRTPRLALLHHLVLGVNGSMALQSELTTAPIVLHFEGGQIRPLTDEVDQALQGFPEGFTGAPGIGESGELPPSSNTGAANTEGGALDAKVDWFQGTFKEVDLQTVLKLFGGESVLGWEGLPNGRYGYQHGMVRGNVRVYCDGQEGMGIHVVASGEGCRQLEAEGLVTQWTGAAGFCARVAKMGFKPSRLDGALDDRAGLVTPERVMAAITEGRCVSYFKKATPRADVCLSTGEKGGWSVRLGSEKSRSGIRIYDKAAEQADKGKPVDGTWVRVELQLRDDRAQELFELMQQDGFELGAVVAGRVYAYCDFKEAGQADTNRSRWDTCAWWSEFLERCQKLRWKGAEVTQTVERAARWFIRQVAPTLALLRFSPQHGDVWLDEAFAQGAERLKEWQLAALRVGAAPVPT